MDAIAGIFKLTLPFLPATQNAWSTPFPVSTDINTFEPSEEGIFNLISSPTLYSVLSDVKLKVFGLPDEFGGVPHSLV